MDSSPQLVTRDGPPSPSDLRVRRLWTTERACRPGREDETRGQPVAVPGPERVTDVTALWSAAALNHDSPLFRREARQDVERK